MSNVKENVFKWIDINKYSTILKYQIDNNIIAFNSKQKTVLDIQNRLKSNEAIIEYYYE
jgi:hypothetical protein